MNISLGVIDGNIDSKRQEHDSQSYQSSLYDFSYTLILIKDSKVQKRKQVSKYHKMHAESALFSK